MAVAMRKLIYIPILILLLCTVRPALAQDEPDRTDTIPHQMVLANLGGMATELIDISYYHAISQTDALGVLAGMIYYPFGHEDVTGFAVALAYRYYPGKRALWRFYVSPEIGYQGAAISPDTTAHGLMIGALVGWQWFPERGFAVGMGFGSRYIFGGNDSPSAALRKPFGLRPAIAFDIGYGW